MQAGRGAKARKAAQSHTGALIGDWATMQTQAEDAGAIVVSTMDEMMDLVQILVRYPIPPTKGPGILTASGAYVGLTNDFAEDIGLELPELEPATLKKVSEVLPAFGNYGNPLDVTAGFSPDRAAGRDQGADRRSQCRDAVHLVSDQLPRRGAKAFNKGHGGFAKPKVMVALGDTWQLDARHHAGGQRKPGGVLALVGPHAARDRALYPVRTLARPHRASPPILRRFRDCPSSAKARNRNGWARQSCRRPASACPTASLPARRRRRRRHRQARRLSGRLEGAGGGARAQDRSRRRHAQPQPTRRRCARPGRRCSRTSKRAAPGVTLDGCLVEKMSAQGSRADDRGQTRSAWGTVLLLGLGGIWVEALGDVRLLPVDADETQIVEALHKLRAAKLLTGFRGAPPVDIAAVAQAVLALGRLMRTTPDIVEIDVNPLMAYAEGQGATALDALIVTE